MVFLRNPIIGLKLKHKFTEENEKNRRDISTPKVSPSQ